MGDLCSPCSDQWRAWLDYRLRPRVQIVTNAARDGTPAGVRERGKVRFRQWADTIRFQQDLIVDQCARQHWPGGAT